MPDNSAAVDNRILGNIVRETNRYARQSLAAKHKDPGSWNKLSLEELKAFLALLIGMSMHTFLRDYWSSDWILRVPAFSKIMALDRFLAIWNNIHLCDNTQMPRPREPNYEKLFKVAGTTKVPLLKILALTGLIQSVTLDCTSVFMFSCTVLYMYIDIQSLK